MKEVKHLILHLDKYRAQASVRDQVQHARQLHRSSFAQTGHSIRRSQQARGPTHQAQADPVHQHAAVAAATIPKRWSTAQMNLSQYNDTDECNVRPVMEDTCLMLPGHSKLEWTFAVNAWIFGAMIGSLSCGHFSAKCGRKTALMGNCIFMIAGGVVQASVSNIWAFAVGRLISGLASGTATGTLGAYVNELSPPHMRNTLGLGLQIFTALGILVPAICFFFANKSSGWRYLAAFPCVLA
ncbi:unnamed protein product [Phytophthora lilii]|uniref:Unnamed protein product n=1 Tax=Phytophthora lilii TaxID=2077276 RepID=A0A9W6TZ78_9STRA|nr:unnamed protein product [Phytophthora lilii]